MKTGKHSINNRIHGNCRALYEQAKSDWTFEEIKDLMKCMAVENGYPAKVFKRQVGDKTKYYKVSRSLAGQDDLTAQILNNTIQAFADENNFWLIDYGEDDKPFRTIGGRDKKQMTEYIKELRDKNMIALAQELEKEV